MPSDTDNTRLSADLKTKLDPRLASMYGWSDEALVERVEQDRATLFSRVGERDRESADDDDSRLPAFVQRAKARIAARAAAARADAARRQSGGDPNQTGTEQRSPVLAATSYTQRAVSPYTAGVSVADDGSPRFRVMVRGEVSTEALQAMGAKVRGRAADVTVCEVARQGLAKLAALKSVKAVELARPVHAALTQVLGDVKPPPEGAVEGGRGESAPDLPPGKGVLIGFVDFGLDLHHTELRGECGHSRVRALWDQAAAQAGTGSTPQPYGYGRAWSNPRPLADGTLQGDIDEELLGDAPPYAVVPHRWDRQGGHEPDKHGPGGTMWMRHGTRVVTVAAGNGRSAHPGVQGIAPEAELLFVSLDPEVRLAGADDVWGVAGVDRVMDGVRWLMQQADEISARRGHDVPLVINLSLADYTGPHDGFSTHQAFLEGLQDVPGRVVVVAAGNAEGSEGHISATLNGLRTLELELEVGEEATADDGLELWIDGDEPVALQVLLPGQAAPVLVLAQDDLVDATTPDGEESVHLLAARVVRDDRRGDATGIRLDMLLRGQRLPAGVWKLRLQSQVQGNRTVHGWLEWNNAGRRRWKNAVDGELTVSDLACHDALLVVGATSKRLDKGLSAPAKVSGRGPTRDGRPKPDIAAPGTHVRTAEAHCRVNRGKETGQEYLTSSGSGTSLSSAIVAGGCAVIMQCRGTKDPETGEPRPAMLSTKDLRHILQASANKSVGAPNGRAVEFVDNLNPVVGAGVMNLRAACDKEVSGVDVWLRAFDGDKGRIPRTAADLWLSPDIVVRPSGTRMSQSGAGAAVQVTVGNRGDKDSQRAEVALGWGLPVTWMPVDHDWLEGRSEHTWAQLKAAASAGQGDVAWLAEGIHAKAGRGAVADIKGVKAAGSATASFSWAAPDGAPRGDQVAWIAVVRSPQDPQAGRSSRTGDASGPDLLRSRNEVAMRSLVVPDRRADNKAVVTVWVHGTAGNDGLKIVASDGAVVQTVALPTLALPLHEGAGDEAAMERTVFGGDPLAGQSYPGEPALLQHWRRGVSPLDAFMARGFASVEVVEDRVFGTRFDLKAEGAQLVLPWLRLGARTLMPLTLTLSGPEGGRVDITHISSGTVVGGITVQLPQSERFGNAESAD